MEVNPGGLCFLECHCSTFETLEFKLGISILLLTRNTWYLFKKAFSAEMIGK